MKTHLIEYDERHVYCKSKSWFLKTTHEISEVTCKPCKAIVDLEEGRINEIPFGGNYDKNGKPRENVNGVRRINE